MMTISAFTVTTAFAILAQTGATPAAAQPATAPAAGVLPAEPDRPDPSSPEGKALALYEEGRDLYTARNWEAAAVKFKEAFKTYDSPDLLYNIAKCYEASGDYRGAVDYYQQYLKKSVAAPDAELVRGLIAQFQEKSKTGAVVESLEDRAAAIASKGRDYYQAGRYADAIAEMQRAYGIVQKSALIYNIAKSYEKMGEYDKAIAHYRSYLQADPQAPDKQDVVQIIGALEARMRQSLNELSVRSVPAAADVYLDDNKAMVGQTPIDVRLPAGKHKLVLVKNGFETIERDFEMPDDRSFGISYPLVKVKNYGGLRVDCNVSAAQIFVDGKILGLTPFTQVKLLQQGEHQVTVMRDGYFIYSSKTTIEKGKLTRVTAHLPEKGELTGWMTTVGAWLGGASLVLGGATAGISYWLGGYFVRGTPWSEGFWTAEWIGLVAGLTGGCLGISLVGLDLVLQPHDIEQTDLPGDELPVEVIKKEENAATAGGAS